MQTMCKNQINPIHCIIPPYMLNKLMQSSNQKIANQAINSNFRSYRFRSDRKFFRDATFHEKTILGAVSLAVVTNVMQMTIYDCKRKTNLSGAKKVWDSRTNKKVTDTSVQNVIKGGKASWDYYKVIFGRNSIDNNGLPLKHFVHYDIKYDNAYWDGRQMVYGDGDGVIFGNFTGDIDIIGHELTHGVMEHEANLEYENQAGALNESFSDIFGIMIKQWYNKQDVKKSNWLIGEKVLIGRNYALRSLKAPGTGYINHPELGTDPQPATMDNYQSLPISDDNGGVHINSGIPNFAFYVAANNMGGYAWEKAGRIWFAALTDSNLASNAKFADVKKLTILHAEKIFGIGSPEVTAVKQGWQAAKV
jgi:Zn-dependent metalloprotease